MVLILKMEDGSTKEFGMGDFIGSLVKALKEADVETIIAGDVARGTKPTVLWEKQFNAVDVVPSSFGKEPKL